VNGTDTHSAHDDEDDMTTMRIGVVAIALSMASGLVRDAGSTQHPGKDHPGREDHALSGPLLN